ncbi:serine hydrolase [Kutzneria sp. CA-103260]|uniref:serine hydrolase n=1 Tax=Kutzneria sp. CA-103260 TaxID=2802641 RepID=UPI001BA7B8B7|nr:serine hydrolase [Kutzneria sp. CA-103260]QUQ71875.1 Putative lipoprotein LppW [Kutzneria sp. CA-103260]
MKRLPATLALLSATVAVVIVLLASTPVTATLAAEREPIPTPTTNSTTTTTTTPPTTTTTPPPTVPPEDIGQLVLKAIDSVSPGTEVGVLAVDTQTGQAVASYNANEPMYTASVVKLLIAIDLLHSQNWAPDAATAAELERMISYSDDDIADSLWDQDGGNSIVTRMVSLIGLTGTQPPDDPSQWGETLMSAQDVVTTYQYIQDDIPTQAQDVLLTGMSNAAGTAADGFQQYFGIPDGLPGTTWAIKQGWMLLMSTTVLDTTGMVGLGPTMPYAVAIMTELPAGTSWATGSNAVTAGAAALKAAFTA